MFWLDCGNVDGVRIEIVMCVWWVIECGIWLVKLVFVMLLLVKKCVFGSVVLRFLNSWIVLLVVMFV